MIGASWQLNNPLVKKQQQQNCLVADMPTATPAQTKVIWKPLPKQQLALACPVNDILFGGAVGGGKTDYLLGDFTKHAAQWGQDAVGLIVRRTLPELRDIMKRAKKMFPLMGAQYKSSERLWTFPNGATLLLNYLESDDDATRYQGQEFTWLGVDEAGQFKSPEPIDFLRSRLRSQNPDIPKRLILTANPGGKGHTWLVERYIKPAPAYTPHKCPETGLERVYIPSRLTDNPYLMADPSYVQRIKGSGPKWLVKALLLGDWSVSINGKIFPRDRWARYETLPKPDFVFQSWDVAAKTGESNDRSACVTIGIKYGVGAFVMDSYAEKLELPDLLKKIKQKATEFNVQTVLIEDASNGIGAIQTLKRESSLFIIPIKPLGKKEDRIIQSSVMVEARRVLIPRFAHWLEDFLTETAGFPQLAHDDIPDALAQAINWLAARYTFDTAGFTYESLTAPKTTPSAPAKTTGKSFFEQYNDATAAENDSMKTW